MTDIVERLCEIDLSAPTLGDGFAIGIARDEILSLRQQLDRLKSDRLYVIGWNDGWEEAVKQAAGLVDGLQVGRTMTGETLKPRRYHSQTSTLIAAEIRALSPDQRTNGERE